MSLLEDYSSFHLCKLTREAVNLQLTSRCLKSRLEQSKLVFNRLTSWLTD